MTYLWFNHPLHQFEIKHTHTQYQDIILLQKGLPARNQPYTGSKTIMSKPVSANYSASSLPIIIVIHIPHFI